MGAAAAIGVQAPGGGDDPGPSGQTLWRDCASWSRALPDAGTGYPFLFLLTNASENARIALRLSRSMALALMNLITAIG